MCELVFARSLARFSGNRDSIFTSRLCFVAGQAVAFSFDFGSGRCFDLLFRASQPANATPASQVDGASACSHPAGGRAAAHRPSGGKLALAKLAARSQDTAGANFWLKRGTAFAAMFLSELSQLWRPLITHLARELHNWRARADAKCLRLSNALERALAPCAAR